MMSLQQIPGFALESFMNFTITPQDTQATIDIQAGLLAAPNRPGMAQWLEQRILDDTDFMRLFDTKFIPALPSTEELLAHPEGSLGHTVGTHLDKNNIQLDFAGINVEAYYKREFTPLMFLGVRALRTHDVCHAILNLDTSPQHEYYLQSFQTAQFMSANPMVLLASGFLHTAFFEPEKIPAFLREVHRFYELGMKAKFLPGFIFEDHWATPIEEVRAMLEIDLSFHF
jgi:ubiquinone biosynthesis protein Coq4